MKLKYHFDAVDMGDEIISVPVGDGAEQVQGVLRLNHSGNEIMELLKDEITEDKIIRILEAKYDNGKEELAEYVDGAIKTLAGAGLIEE